jgi:hypothetical protein
LHKLAQEKDIRLATAHKAVREKLRIKLNGFRPVLTLVNITTTHFLSAQRLSGHTVVFDNEQDGISQKSEFSTNTVLTPSGAALSAILSSLTFLKIILSQ